jgi:hypothetical protein
MHIPKPPKTEKKQPKPVKHTAIVRKASWKPLKRSSAAAAALIRRTLIARSRRPLVAKTELPKRRSPIARCNVRRRRLCRRRTQTAGAEGKT